MIKQACEKNVQWKVNGNMNVFHAVIIFIINEITSKTLLIL